MVTGMAFKKSAGLLTVLAIALVLVSSAAYAQTPAGTTIRNQASATFEDLSGNTYMATSNEVTTIVLPVYGVSVLPDGTAAAPGIVGTAIPGQTVYYSYNLTNTGNDFDNFTIEPLIDPATTMTLGLGDIDIYHDVNGNGVLDGGEPVISAAGVPGNIGPIAAGTTLLLLIEYQVPALAAAGEVAYVGIEATSVGDVAQVDTDNYHQTDVVSDAVLTATMTGLPVAIDPGNVATYTVTGQNVGNDVANGVFVASVTLTGVLIYDILPTDPSTGLPLALAGAPAGAPAGVFLYLPSGSATVGAPETWAWVGGAAAGDIAIAYVTSGGLVIGQNYNFTYDVIVPLTMPAGIINNDGAVAFVDNNAGTPDPTIVTTNNTQIDVNVLANVLVGTNGVPDAGTAPLHDDDSQAVAVAYANQTVDFINTVRNDGNAADEINIVLDAGSSTFPAGFGIQFFRIDGVTPLNDTGTDGIPDVGTINPGVVQDFIVRITIPGDAVAGGPYLAVVNAVSENDPTELNVTTDEITQVNPASVDIGNYDGAVGTTNNPANIDTAPGLSVDFPLDVINTGGSSDNFGLSSTIPAGWTMTFYLDANGNGILDNPELLPIANVGPIVAGGEVNIIARVDVPVGEIPGVNATTFRATSVNNNLIFDEIANTVTVLGTASVTITPDRNGTGTANGTVRYQHTVTNTGNVDDTFMLTALSTNAWSYAFFDLANNPIASVTLVAGATQDVFVQLSIPGGVAIGTIETGTITVTGNGTGATDSATDVTTIVAGNLVLTKSVTPVGNQLPGTELTYRTDYANVGVASLANIVIYDAIPAWTQFRVGSESDGTLAPGIASMTTAFSDDGGATWVLVPASGGGGAPAGFDARVTNVRWTLTGTLAGGASTADGVSLIVRIIAE